MNLPALALLLGSLTVLPGCGWLGYKIDIQQGNIVTQDMVNKLRPGMDPRQVRYIMGTPLLVDPFHTNRWDYYFSDRPGGSRREVRRITLVFDNDRLVRIEGDVRPEGMGGSSPGESGG